MWRIFTLLCIIKIHFAQCWIMQETLEMQPKKVSRERPIGRRSILQIQSLGILCPNVPCFCRPCLLYNNFENAFFPSTFWVWEAFLRERNLFHWYLSRKALSKGQFNESFRSAICKRSRGFRACKIYKSYFANYAIKSRCSEFDCKFNIKRVLPG